MDSTISRGLRARALLLLVVVVAGACDSPPPSPSGSAVAPEPSERPPATKVVGDLQLDACDPSELLPCERQAVVLVEPIAATGVAMTYSTEWSDARLDRPEWNADSLGLGGWSLDVVQRYDAERGILLGGDGDWRFAPATALGGGEVAIPSIDGGEVFVFDAAWKHVRTVDGVTGITILRLEYDDAGRLHTVRGQRGGGPVELAVETLPDGAPSALLGIGGRRTLVGLGSDGRLSALFGPEGMSLAVKLEGAGLVAAVERAGRGADTFQYDATGRLTKRVDADGVTWALGFESANGTTAVTLHDPGGGTSTWRTERAGDVVRRTYTAADGTVAALDTEPDGTLRLAAPDGTTTSLGSQPHPVWGVAVPIRTPMTRTLPSGQVSEVVRTITMTGLQAGATDVAWRVERTLDGQTSTDAYDPATRTRSRTDALGRASTVVYDSLARPIEVQPADGPLVRTSYDATGRVARVVTGAGDAALTTTYEYDTATGVVTEHASDGTTAQASLDAFGRPIQAANDRENVSLVRDAAGGILQLRSGVRPAAAFGYSPAGRVTAYLPPVVEDDASYETTTYSPAGTVARIDGPGDRRIEVKHDLAGRPTSWTFDRGQTTRTYDATSGLLVDEATGRQVTTYRYDGSVLTGIGWSGTVDGDVRVTFDPSGNRSEESVNGSALPFAYDAAGALTGVGDLVLVRDGSTGRVTRRSAGAVEVTSAYDVDGRASTTRVTSGGRVVLVLQVMRDVRGRVMSSTITHGTSVRTTTYAYDASGRLERTQVAGEAAATFSYDPSGNRVRVAIDGKKAATATFDDRDRLVRRGDVTFRYEPDGTLRERMSSAGTTTYDLDDLGALRAVALPDGTRIEYVVDGAGRRVGRLVGGELTDRFLYGLKGELVAWLAGNGTTRARLAYDDLGRLALVRQAGRELVAITDQVGSAIALVDAATGDVVRMPAYDAWGVPTGRSAGPDDLPIGFAGGLSDAATGLVHFGARDYDPSTGRWISPDPLRYGGGDQNLYRYAHGDPVNNVDPSGTTWCPGGACAAATGAAGATPALRGGVAVEMGPAQIDQPSLPVEIGPAQIDEPSNPVDIGPAVIEPPDAGGGGAAAPAPGGVTVCVGSCVGPGGVSGLAPGSPASCLGLCIPPTAYTAGVCLGVCAGGPGGGGFACVGSCFFGEPHLRTADGLDIDFQVAGEFVLARAGDGSLEIQARFEPVRATSDATRGTAVAMRVAGDRIGFYADATRPLVINGEVVTRADYARTLPRGGVVERHGTAAFVRLPDGTRVDVAVYPHFVNLSVSPAAAGALTYVGVLPSGDGDPGNDVTTRDGVVMDPGAATFAEQTHGEFADSWRITDSESLFDYLPGQSTATFQKRDIPQELLTVDDLDPGTRDSAAALCRALGVRDGPILTSCIFDVGMTGDPAYAAAAATVASSLARNTGDGGTATAIERGTAVTGDLVAGTVDRYRFAAKSGDIVYLDAGTTCSPGLAWQLLRPGGALFAFGEGCEDIGRRVLPEAGDWRIEISSDEAVGGHYEFTVLSVPVPREATIRPGQEVAGSTTSAGEWHRYELTATAGQVVYLDATAGCDPDVWWRLLRPDGSLAWFENACTDLGRRVLTDAGTWVIEIYADDTATGAYAFRVIDAPAAQERATSIGATETERIGRTGEWHRYRLGVAKGDVAYLDALGECVPGLSWRLLRPDASLVGFGTTCTDIGRRVFDVAGDWTIEVYADGLETGAYSFRVIGAPRVRRTEIELGTKVTGSIASIGEWHRFALTAGAGQAIVIDTDAACVPDLWWRLLRPDGSLTTFGSTCTDSTVQTLDVAGEWVIEIYSDTLATGSYAFTARAAP